MNAYGQPAGRRPSRPHASLGTLLGLGLLVVFVPYSLDYGLAGLAGTLLAAGVAGGMLAHGGVGLGFRVGARAASIYVLILLSAYLVLLLQDAGMLDLAAYPELAEFVPYLVGMRDLWARIALALAPLVDGLIAMINLSFVDLLIQAAVVVLPAGVGGSISGSFSGSPTPRPMAGPPQAAYPPEAAYYPDPVYEYGGPEPIPTGPTLECPWCGMNISPDMDDCWNCGGPLRMPPPNY